MPRNTSGTYLLPAGNPVATNTLIESEWANSTLADVAQALTESLDRYGRSTMQAPLLVQDGSVAKPGLAFGAETTSGLWRAGTHDVRLAIAGIDIVKFTSSGLTVLKDLSITGNFTGVMKL